MEDLSVQLALAFGGLQAEPDIPVKTEDEDEHNDGEYPGPDDEQCPFDDDPPPRNGRKGLRIRILTRRDSLLNLGNIYRKNCSKFLGPT